MRPIGYQDSNGNDLFEGDKVRCKYKVINQVKVIEGFVRYFKEDDKFKVITREQGFDNIHHIFGEEDPGTISIELLENAPSTSTVEKKDT